MTRYLFFLLLLLPTDIAAQAETLDCHAVHDLIANLATIRDVGADEQRVRERLYEQNPRVSRRLLAWMEAEIHRLWEEKQPSAEAALAAYNRCQEQLGRPLLDRMQGFKGPS